MPKVDLWAHIEIGDEADCWPWTGRLDEHGYGRLGKRSLMVHRVVYELFTGPIPDGFQVDHTCHNRSNCAGGDGCAHRRCANPRHLEAVTQAENALRGKSFSAINAVKTHCPQGHPYDEANTYVWSGNGARACRTCKANRDRQRIRA